MLHWRVARQHGAFDARNQAGGSEVDAGVPLCWPAQQIALYYVDHASGLDEVVFDGVAGEGPFIACYLHKGRPLEALAAAGRG